ncbi:helix-turn-helix domain-containing protein [Nocardia carnea]|uniref:helix-turn-helix domain-containing protein n=1 Tax=Nocardia carnea TaxID=37328 RepID=UPI0024553143|nr:helix-turn-helix domain-containing protein [Nocardia carnea]
MVDDATDTADVRARTAELRALTRRVNDGDAARAQRTELIRRLYAAGWKQAELSAAAEVSQQAISKLTSGAVKPA